MSSHLTRRRALAGLALLAATSPLLARQSFAQHRHAGDQHRPHGQQQRPGTPDMSRDKAQEMARDGIFRQDRERVRTEDIYGSKLMTAEEQNEYRRRLENAGTDREWARIRAEHEREIQARARAQGVDIDPPIYGQHMMTMEERRRYTRRMQDAANDGEREMIRDEHREFIRRRARELGVDVPPPQ